VTAALVSCIIPVYNGAAFIRDAVQSILAQTGTDTEIIVVDDGSTDDTPAVVATFGETVRYLHQTNRGPAAARNAGIACARGDWIAFLDADDLWLPGKLPSQLRRFGERPELQVVFGGMRNVPLPGTDEAVFRPEQWPAIPFSPCTMLARRGVFDQVGLFDPNLRRGEDTEWFVRMMMRGVTYEVLPDLVLERRIHGANLSAEQLPSPQDVVRVLKLALDRRRREGW
jgi:glycosyltransferase involved in cell wall biosynthesis